MFATMVSNSHSLSQVAQEIEFQIYSKCFLTEPYVAHVIGEVLNDDTSLFIGNSMVIRDIDMYGKGWLSSMSCDYQTVSNLGVEFQGFRVAGNRGASGIDGVLSTAVGFAVGCNKHVSNLFDCLIAPTGQGENEIKETLVVQFR